MASKPPPRTSGPRKPRARKHQEGPFAETFLHKLKTAPLGTPDAALIMETLRSAPLHTVMAALAKAGPKERALLFNLIPNDQIKSIVASLPETFLSPLPIPPPAPLPAPTGGPPASILMTT
jgi:hypothetical protein